MASRGFFFDLTDEMENSGHIHRRLIVRIERATRRNLVCYFASAGHPGGAMQDHDPDLLENVLRSINLAEYDGKLDLLINSPGGFPYAAAKIVRVCRTFSSSFRAIVVGRAMSAATLLCLGSDELVMSPTASLGPIDPQMVRGDRLVPAHVIVDSFKEMVGAAQQAIGAKQPPDPFFHVLDSLDVTAVFESIKALNATKSIAKDLLESGLLRREPGRIEAAVKALVAEGEKELHAKHLFPEVLTSPQIGIPVTRLEVGSKEDRLLRELFVRSEVYANRKGLAKYLASRQGGIDVNVQVRRIPS